jgi:hypothetical protein
MPYNRPGRGVYVTNNGTTRVNGDPVALNNIVGVCIKQKAPTIPNLPVDAKTIQAGEDFFIVAKGIVQVPAVGGVAKGDAIYITSATSALGNASGAGIVPYGRVVELAGSRGTPTGKMRVDLDLKDSI